MIAGLSHLLKGTRIAILVTCAVLILSNRTIAVTVTIESNGDTYLRQELPDYNYGADIDLHLRNNTTGSGDRNILIGFDVSSIPSNACILQATLRLFQYESSYMSVADWVKVGAYRLLKTADEGTGGFKNGATWNHRHAGGQNAWSEQGARGRTANPDRHCENNIGIPDSVMTLTYIPTGGQGRWVDWDITPSAQYWHRNPTKNFGVVLDKWLEGSFSYDDDQLVKFWSREYPDQNYRPQLVVEYIIPSAQPLITFNPTDFNLNVFTGDPNIVFSQSGNQVICSGTTSDTIWDANGCVTKYTLNDSFECEIAVKLEQGIVNVSHGQFAFEMFQSVDKFISIQAVGFGSQYYEISGACTAVGNGKSHDGNSYWASYWDDGYPTGPPSAAVRFFSQTPENEATTYMLWKIRYDKPNKLFLAYVNGELVTYYTEVDFSNWRLAITHSNDCTGVPTTVRISFPDNAPPSPNPMTWATEPVADSTSNISMVATTASDSNPPIQYYFNETTGNPGATHSGWITDRSYSDSGLSPNTQYGYRVKARDSVVPPNEGNYSSTVLRYTLIPRPAGVSLSNIQATSVTLDALGSFPNLNEGLTGTQFVEVDGAWQGDWKLHSTSDVATGLTPNTQYKFRVKSRNGDGIDTMLSWDIADIRTPAAQPTVMAYSPVTTQSFRANWGANGNPAGTEYFCREVNTGRMSGWITDTNWTLTGLQENQQYQVMVKARNAALKETTWTDLGIVMTTESIGTIKITRQEGDFVALRNKVVTAVFGKQKLIFVQDWPDITKPLGGAGIAVRIDSVAPPMFVEGQTIDMYGRLAYNDPPYSEELVVNAQSINIAGRTSALQPFGGSGINLGGAAFGCQPGLYDDVTSSPTKRSFGLNTVGMLVKAWGILIDKELKEIFWIDDGSNLFDGEMRGVRFNLKGMGPWIPPGSEYVSVTGIMRCFVQEPGGHNVREIWPRSLSDLTVYADP